MRAPLADLTILEPAGDIATRYCGKLFAAHGARVIALGARPNAGLAYGGASATAYAAWLDHGKQLVAEIPADITPDLVIAGQTQADIADAEAIVASFAQRPLLLALTWFGATGPCANWRGTDGIIQAMSGVAYAIGPAKGPPIIPQGHAPQIVGGTTGFIVSLSALLGRRNGRACDRIDSNIFEAFLCLTEGGAPSVAAGGPATKRRGVNLFGPVYPQTIFPTSDGWIGVSALTPLQWKELCGLIGLPDLARDPRYATTDLRLAAAPALDAILGPAILKLKADEFLLAGQARRVPLAPVPDMAGLLQTPHWRERGSFETIAGVEGPAMPFRLHGRGDGAVRAGGPGAGPLAGIRVLDLAMGWSGPLAGRHFADLGAEVIKIEGCAHMDWWRGWNALEAGDPPPYETKSNFNAVNRNKRGITLDLRSKRGREILMALAADADLLIENYAPGVLNGMGLSAAALAAINPRLSYISMGAFGSAGPWSGFRAYGSTTEQAAGMPFLHGEPDWPPLMQHTAYGDPIAGIYAAAASLIALYGRHHTGGVTIDLSQVECLFQLAADGIVAQSATGAAPARTGSMRATGVWRGCLRCAGDDAWIAVDVETNTQSESLGDLAAWAATRTPRDAAQALQQMGIAAGPVTPGTSLFDDPQLAATGFWLHADRRYVGDHVLPRAPYLLDGKAPAVLRPTPTLGQHNAEVLAQVLGLSAANIATLEHDNIIGTKAV
jgi:crotonobetainyl-CoA:carnitine CoA-transferase CaiB-like acyl-CoA transferase